MARPPQAGLGLPQARYLVAALGQQGLRLCPLAPYPRQVGIGRHPAGQLVGVATIATAARKRAGLRLDQPLPRCVEQVGRVLVRIGGLRLLDGLFGPLQVRRGDLAWL